MTLQRLFVVGSLVFGVGFGLELLDKISGISILPISFHMGMIIFGIVLCQIILPFWYININPNRYTLWIHLLVGISVFLQGVVVFLHLIQAIVENGLIIVHAILLCMWLLFSRNVLPQLIRRIIIRDESPESFR